MAQSQREVYQPPLERVTTFDLRDDDIEDERARLPLLIVIALLVLAAFSGVVWLAYNQGVARGRAGAPVIIAAPAGPLRTIPTDQTADDVPYTGLKVYGKPMSPDQEASDSTLASGSEPEASNLDNAAPPPKPAQAKAAAETPRLNPVNIAPSAGVAKPVPTEAVVKKTAMSSAKPAPAIVKPQSVSPPQPAPAPTVMANAAPAVSAPPVETPIHKAAASGSTLLQIGAYPTQVLANDAWKKFKAKHTGIVGDLSEDVKQADLGAKGTWYRLRVGPFADKGAADSACDHLKSEGASCFLAAP